MLLKIVHEDIMLRTKFVENNNFYELISGFCKL